MVAHTAVVRCFVKYTTVHLIHCSLHQFTTFSTINLALITK